MTHNDSHRSKTGFQKFIKIFLNINKSFLILGFPLAVIGMAISVSGVYQNQESVKIIGFLLSGLALFLLIPPVPTRALITTIPCFAL